MCKRSPQMNMKQLEAVVAEILRYDNETGVLSEALRHDFERAIKYIQSRQRAAKRRSAHFKFLADERRELLR